MVDGLVKQKVREIHPELVKMRRYLHQHPEMGYQEVNTAKFIAEKLEALGLEVKTGLAQTGVTGLLKGGKPGKTIALRADMDALTITEKTGLSYASINEGVMHACGHDGHVASLLGVAVVLSGFREWIPGNIKFIFQPAEEGPGGAEKMIAEGALEGVDAIIGVHLWMDVPAGKIGVKYGGAMACLDAIDVTVKGKGGHGSMPHQTVDAVAVAAQVINTIQTIAAREVNPVDPVVISIGTINGGHAYNIIAEEVKMKGTVRAIDHELRRSLPERIERIIEGVTKSMRATYEFEYHFGYPPLFNDHAMTALVEKTAQRVVGEGNVIRMAYPTMAGEDMAYYLEKVPGTFVFVGINNPEKGIIYPHHNPKFNLDEGALGTATELLTLAALDFLNARMG